MFSKTEDQTVHFTSLQWCFFDTGVCVFFFFLTDFKHENWSNQKLIKCILNVPKMQEMVSLSPKYSLALPMYLSDT